MTSIQADDGVGSSSKPSSRGPLEESNNSWDESMLTAAFDSQLKLVKKSLEPPQQPPPAATQPVPQAATKSARSSAKSKTKESTKREVKSEVKPDKDSKILVTHSSRKFRFEDGLPESSVADSVKKEPATITTTTKANQTVANSTMVPPSGCMMPPPFDTSKFPEIANEDEARASMLMSWYMAGYHTGYFEATRKHKKPV